MAGQDDDPDCVGKEHRRDIIHLQGIILLLAGSQKARARTLCILFLFSPLYLLSALPPPPPPSLFSCRKNRGAESPLPLFNGQRARERSSEEPPREQRSCDRSSSAENRGGMSVPRVSPAIHLSVNRRPSGKLPALSVHREQLHGSSFFSDHCSTVFGIIRARNALSSLIFVSLPSGTTPPLSRFTLPSFRRLLSGLAQTCNSNKRKIRAAVRPVIAAQFDKIAGSALGEREQHRLSFALALFSRLHGVRLLALFALYS